MDRGRKKTDKDEDSDETNNSQTQQSTNHSTRVNSISRDGGTNTIIACGVTSGKELRPPTGVVVQTFMLEDSRVVFE